MLTFEGLVRKRISPFRLPMIQHRHLRRHRPDFLHGMVGVELFDNLRQGRGGRLILMKRVDNHTVVGDLVAAERKPVGRQVLFRGRDVHVRPDQVARRMFLGKVFDLPTGLKVVDLLPPLKIGVLDGVVNQTTIRELGTGLQFCQGERRRGVLGRLFWRLRVRWDCRCGRSALMGPNQATQK